jgi:hypothetical protein
MKRIRPPEWTMTLSAAGLSVTLSHMSNHDLCRSLPSLAALCQEFGAMDKDKFGDHGILGIKCPSQEMILTIFLRWQRWVDCW